MSAYQQQAPGIILYKGSKTSEIVDGSLSLLDSQDILMARFGYTFPNIYITLWESPQKKRLLRLLLNNEYNNKNIITISKMAQCRSAS